MFEPAVRLEVWSNMFVKTEVPNIWIHLYNAVGSLTLFPGHMLRLHVDFFNGQSKFTASQNSVHSTVGTFDFAQTIGDQGWVVYPSNTTLQVV